MSRLTWAMAGCVGLAAVVGSAAGGFTVAGLPRLAVVAGVLALAAWHYRRVGQFRLCLSALLLLVLFSSGFVVLTYLAARLAPPLIDGCLAGCDARLGFSTANLAAWQGRHPAVGAILNAAYDSLLPQTAATVALLGLLGRRGPLEAFLRRMMLAAILVLAFFLLLPAVGPCGASPSASQAHYLDHFLALRSGLRSGLSLADTEGLITFPSFHTVWALLLVAACPRPDQGVFGRAQRRGDRRHPNYRMALPGRRAGGDCGLLRGVLACAGTRRNAALVWDAVGRQLRIAATICLASRWHVGPVQP